MEKNEKIFSEEELVASLKDVEGHGFAILEEIYTYKEIADILSIIECATQDEKRFRRTEDLFAIRSLLKEIPQLKPVLFNPNLRKLVKEGFGTDYFLTKAIYFDKPPKSNWYVTWHQDVPINVQEKIQTEGFRGWTNKAGLICVMPPPEYLYQAFTVRIHLDNTDEKNGALQVIPKSHFKILTKDEIAEMRESRQVKFCKIRKGGINLLKPLTLHASSKTENDRHRRIIHLEFNKLELPGTLEWLEKELV